MTAATRSSILALDVGTKRVGVAVASVVARLPRPLTTLEHNDHLLDALKALAKEEGVSVVVVGLPRGMSGQHTKQTRFTENFAERLRNELSLPVHMQDEALTSHQAEAELSRKGTFTRAEVDALAATYILEDYLREHYNGGGN